MSTVSVREFAYNHSAMFARVELGEMIQVTRHGQEIAVLLPGSGMLGRYASLVARGIIRLKATTTGDLDRIPQYPVSADVSPLEVLLAERDGGCLVIYLHTSALVTLLSGRSFAYGQELREYLAAKPALPMASSTRTCSSERLPTW